MSVHYDIEAVTQSVRAQLEAAAGALPPYASEASRIRMRHPEVVVQTVRMVTIEKNNGRHTGDIIVAMIENLVDQVVSMAGGPEHVTDDIADNVTRIVHAKLMSVRGEDVFLRADIPHGAGGHA